MALYTLLGYLMFFFLRYGLKIWKYSIGWINWFKIIIRGIVVDRIAESGVTSYQRHKVKLCQLKYREGHWTCCLESTRDLT